MRSLRICLVGGIFGKPDSYRQHVRTTPETTLLAGLRARGHEIEPRPHFGPYDVDGFDILHVHHLSWGAVAFAAGRGRTRLVFTAHRSVPSSPFVRGAMRYVAWESEAIVALSEDERRWQQASLGFAPTRQRVIANGIDDRVFTFVPPPAEPPWRLLYVGQLIEEKGVRELLSALSILRPSVRVELDLVFHVDTLERELRDQAEALGLEGVRFLGPRSPEQLHELYASCHALVLPSYYNEALPSVITEALFVGRPVIATDVGAIREQLGPNGLLVAQRDPHALAQGVQELLGRYGDFTAPAELASRRARERYSVDAMVSAHETLYLELLESPDRRRRHALMAPASRALAALARRKARARAAASV